MQRPSVATPDASRRALLDAFESGRLEEAATFDAALDELSARRAADLSALKPADQAALVARRTSHLIPSPDDLAARIERAATEGRPLHVKFGIDPTSPDIHIGHAVPMILLGRFQRMGHLVTLVIGDITARIGDPSGRVDERPPLTEDDIAANMAQYRDQMAPLFDFTKAQLRFNSEWLAGLRLVELLPLLAHVPVSQSMQRDDFRQRLTSGHSLTMAEQLYSVVMAMDSVELNCDVEIGGVDQLLNMQMCRTLMEVSGQVPEIVCTTPLIEGIDGSGTKMSKSRGNYVAIASEPGEMYGKLMSIPDQLMPQYLRMLTEMDDDEIDAAVRHQPPQHLKHLLAATVVDTFAGRDAATEAKQSFVAQFSERRLASATDLPTVSRGEAQTVGAVLTDVLGFAPSKSQCRRVADQGGLQVVVEESGAPPRRSKLDKSDVDLSIADLVARVTHEDPAASSAALFLRLGRKVAALVD